MFSVKAILGFSIFRFSLRDWYNLKANYKNFTLNAHYVLTYYQDFSDQSYFPLNFYRYFINNLYLLATLFSSTNNKLKMTSETTMTNVTKFDLEERTSLFGENIIDFINILPNNDVNSVLKKQLIRSSTSIGANYMEADAAETKRRYQIFLMKLIN